MIYLSGKITGNPLYKHEFRTAESTFKALGFEVFNPALIDLGAEATWSDYMKRDIPELCKCDTIVMIKGWIWSKGARLERKIAKKLGLTIIEFNPDDKTIKGLAEKVVYL